MARNDLPNPNAANFSQRLREAVMTYLGRQGDPLDRGVTLRDLIEGGIARLRDGYTAGQAAASGGALPIAPEVQAEEPDLTPPPTPTGFAVSAAISHVFIEHDSPLYLQGHGHLRTRVYGKVVAPGDPLPVFAGAAEITQFTGTIHSHPSNPATTWRLWIKWESVDGVLSVSPAGGTNGLEAGTGKLRGVDLGPLIVEAGNLANAAVTAQKIAPEAIDPTKFSAGIEPITIVSSLPATKVTSSIFHTADGKLYRWNGSAYVATVPTSDLTGTVADAQIAGLAAAKVTGQLTDAQIAALAAAKLTGTITASQIADGAVSGTKFASGIEPVSVAASLPGSKTTSAVFLTTDGKLYRWSGSAYVATVAAGDISGTISDVQIAGVAASKVTGQLTDAQIQAVAAAKVSGQLTNAQLADIAATKVTGQLSNAQIADVAASKLTGTITETQIGDNAISAPKIAAGAISTAKLAAGAVTADTIAANAITSAKIEAGAITTAKIAAGAVTAGEIAAGSVTTAKLSAGAVTANELAAGSVVADKIGANAVTAGKIEAGAVTTAKLAAGAVTASTIAADAITSDKIAANAVTADEIAANAITSGKISAGAVTATQLAADAVTADKLAANAVTAVKIEAGAVTTAKLAAGAVTADTLAANAVTAAKIEAGAVTTAKLAASAVTAIEIAAGAVTAGKIAANAVTAAELAADAVTAGKIAAGAITATKLAANAIAVGSAAIENGAIVNAMIGNLAVDNTKIADLSADKLTSGTIAVGQFVQSTGYSSGQAGFRIDGDGNAEFNNATVRGTVFASDGQFTGELIALGPGKKARMWAGDFEAYKDVPGVGLVLYKALSRVESGVGANNVQVTIPGYFLNQPQVIVSPANIRLYDSAYANQTQSLQCEVRDLVQTAAGSMVWRFTPVATLSLGASAGQVAVNQSSGQVSTGWTSGQYVTPANTTTITPSVTLASYRGTGTSGGYYRRTARWRVQYLNGGTWVDGAWTTIDLASAVNASATSDATFTFPSAGAWTFRIQFEAYDTGGTFSTTVEYEYATDSVTRSDAQTIQAQVAFGSPNSASASLNYVPSYTLPSGWTLTGVSFSYVYSYSVSSNGFNARAEVAQTPYSGGLSLVAPPNSSGSNLSRSRSASSNTLIFSVSATRAFSSESATATLTLHSVSGTYSRRRPLTNSTTAANTFTLGSYGYQLNSAQVLASGTLNWVAIGE